MSPGSCYRSFVWAPKASGQTANSGFGISYFNLMSCASRCFSCAARLTSYCCSSAVGKSVPYGGVLGCCPIATVILDAGLLIFDANPITLLTEYLSRMPPCHESSLTLKGALPILISDEVVSDQRTLWPKLGGYRFFTEW
jgi:hypothetical protein